MSATALLIGSAAQQALLKVARSVCVYVWSLYECCLSQVGKVLGNDPGSRAAFVHSGGLAAVQHMAEAPGSKLKEAVEIINSAYPEEIVKYYSPQYSQQLLERLQTMTTQAAY